MAYGFNDDKSKVEVATKAQINSVIDSIISISEAYEVGDNSEHGLVFFRDSPDKYTDGQQIGNKIYHTNIETTPYAFNYAPPWTGGIDSIFMNNLTNVNFKSIIKPISTCMWFFYASILENLNVRNLDTSNVTNMSGMFNGCSSLESLDLSNFDTSNVTNMANMFRNCNSLESLDLSNFDTSNVTNMSYMFHGCNNLTTTLVVSNMPNGYTDMCKDAASESGQLILKYKYPVTSADIDLLVATKGSGNVVNGGQA